MQSKVDVVINCYGKPYQTIATLQSLLSFNAGYIDRIFLIVEKKQPFFSRFQRIKKIFPNVEVFTPKYFEFICRNVDYCDFNSRYKVRYQYAIENSDKKYLFVSHNDVLYTGDIIYDMLLSINGFVGVGQIGQCWNCPANYAQKCDGNRYYDFRPNIEELKEIISKHPSPRTSISTIDFDNPHPLPECRLNEWACLINRELIIKESKPFGEGPLFGEYDQIDLGTKWFRYMNSKGYKFLNYNQKFIHGFWAKNAGYPTQKSWLKYFIAEYKAYTYLKKLRIL